MALRTREDYVTRFEQFMAWRTREDYVTRLEQFMARFNTSARVIYIPIHMISDETINVMYQYVRR